MHAATQSSHIGQLDVAHGSQKRPGPHESHVNGSQASVHSPLPTRQTWPGPQSAVEVQGPPVVDDETVVETFVLVLVEPAPPAPESSKTTLPPQAAPSEARNTGNARPMAGRLERMDR
jgi:hypothetical protein